MVLVVSGQSCWKAFPVLLPSGSHQTESRDDKAPRQTKQLCQGATVVRCLGCDAGLQDASGRFGVRSPQQRHYPPPRTTPAVTVLPLP